MNVACQGDTLIIKGELTLSQVSSLWADRQNWLMPSTRRIQLAEVKRIDSAGLTLLLEVESLVKGQGEQLQWCECPKPLINLMRLYDLYLDNGQLVGLKPA